MLRKKLYLVLFLLLSFNIFSISYGDVYSGFYEYGNINSFYLEVKYVKEVDGYHIKKYWNQYDGVISKENEEILFIQVEDYIYDLQNEIITGRNETFYCFNDETGKKITVINNYTDGTESSIMVYVKREIKEIPLKK